MIADSTKCVALLFRLLLKMLSNTNTLYSKSIFCSSARPRQYTKIALLSTRMVKRVTLFCILLWSAAQAQIDGDSISVRFNTDLHYPGNKALERLAIIDPSLRVHDFISNYSPFDAVRVGLEKLRFNPVFADDLHFRFMQGISAVSLSIADESNSVAVEPILGYKIFADNEAQRFTRRTNGLKLFGNLGDHVVFFASAADNLERGKILDKKKEMEATNGFVISNDQGDKGFDFDEAQAQLGFRWGRTEVFLEKLRNRWGYGETGNVVLSEKAPSYPQARLAVNLTKSLKFTYVLASLYSDVVDSLESYRDQQSDSYRRVYRSKYLASHVLEYAPTSSLNIALGESMVFSDRFQPVYLLPLAFFRSAEHQNRDTDNAQMFAGIRYSFPTVGTFYGTLFIDDLNIDKMFSDQNTNIIAWTIGGRVIDVFWNNFDCTLEYTKLNPWVYTHKFEATTYISSGYTLGHWLGQNADIVYASIQYRWIRSLSLNLYAQKIRKGILGSSEVHYGQTWAQKFLEGPLFKQTQVGLKGRCEVYRYLFLNWHFSILDQTDEVENRYPSFSNRFFVDVSISYNLFE